MSIWRLRRGKRLCGRDPNESLFHHPDRGVKHDAGHCEGENESEDDSQNIRPAPPGRLSKLARPPIIGFHFRNSSEASEQLAQGSGLCLQDIIKIP